MLVLWCSAWAERTPLSPQIRSLELVRARPGHPAPHKLLMLRAGLSLSTCPSCAAGSIPFTCSAPAPLPSWRQLCAALVPITGILGSAR